MIRAARLVKRYPLGVHHVTALDGVDLEVAAGEFVAVLGRSGSGKSTLLNLAGGLDVPTSGELTVGGQRIDEMAERDLALYRRRTVGFVFQSYHLVPAMDARRNVELPLLLAGVPRPVRRRRAEDLLERVGLKDRMTHAPSKLSGGEQQRVAVARALAHDPSLLLADEPTGNLDSRSAADILGLLRELHAGGKTVLLVTHDLGIAKAHAKRLLTMADGKVAGDERL